MNPLFVVPLFVYAAAATAWPNQVDGRRRGMDLLWVEVVIVAVALLAVSYLATLAEPKVRGLFWGKVALYATVYLYICGRGATVVRAMLEVAPLQFRRVEDRSAGAVGIARGRAIGILERALVLTLVLLGEYATIGFIFIAKGVIRYRSLEDPETAEYFLIGTMGSLLLAVLGAAGLRILLH